MKPIPQSRTFNNVQLDIMWRQRISKESLSLIDSFSGSKAQEINKQIALQKQQHFYTNQVSSKPQVANPFNTTATGPQTLNEEVLSQLSKPSRAKSIQSTRSFAY